MLLIRSIFVEFIDKSFAWGFFDGSVAGEPKICGAWGMLYISNEHYFSYRAGLGLGTNNYAELCALELLLFLATRNHLEKIQIFDDSQLVINWASGKYILMNLELSMILQDVNRIFDGFDYVSFQHIYRERNSSAYALAKSRGRILEGSWSIMEHRANAVVETFQVF